MQFILGDIKNGFEKEDDGYYANIKIEFSGIIHDLYDIYLLDFLHMIDNIIKKDEGEIGKYWDNEDYGTRYFDEDLPYIKIERKKKVFVIKIRWIKEELLIDQNEFIKAYSILRKAIISKCNISI